MQTTNKTKTMKKGKKSCNSIELITQINQLKTFCGLGIQNTDGDNSSVNLKRAYKYLKKISTRYDHDSFQKLKYENINDLIKCCFVFIANSISHFRSESMLKISKQSIMKARQRYRDLLNLLIPIKLDDVIDIVMNILRDEALFEGFVIEVLKSLWSCCNRYDLIMERILNMIENLIIENKIDKANCIARGLSKSIDDNIIEISADGLTRLLLLYHLSVEAVEPHNKFYHLKNGFENSLIKIFNVMKIEEVKKLLPKFLNLTFETKFVSELAMKEFALVLKYAFMRFSTCKIEENLVPEIFEYLLASMTLDCKTKSLLACRYLTYLVDHSNNFDEFSIPKIFYEGTPYKIKISRTESESAIKIIEDYRQLIQSSFLSAIKLHGCITSNLCAIFKVICIMIVSIPSSSTFIMVITTLMQLQTFVLDGESSKFTPVDKNHIHAFIISVMTLICWVTRAKSLTRYINEIVRLRFSIAPHLNPPLKKFYEYENHHVLGYKADLFLDKWEIRYCLWNRYRLNEDKLSETSATELTRSEIGESKKSSRFFSFRLFRQKSKETFSPPDKLPPDFDIDLNKF